MEHKSRLTEILNDLIIMISKLKEIIVIILIVAQPTHNQTTTCKADIMISYGLKAHKEKMKPNILCPKVTNNCCDEISQLKLHKYFSTRFLPYMKQHYEDSNAALVKLQPIFEEKAKIDFKRIQHEYLTANFDIKEDTKVELNKLISKIEEVNSDTLMLTYADIVKKQPEMLTELSTLRSGLICSICNSDNHKFIDFSVGTITYKSSFCSHLIFKYFNHIHNKYYVLMGYLLNLSRLLKLITDTRLFADRNYRESINKYYKSLEKCKTKPDHIDNCTDVCSEFKINQLTPLYDAESKQISELSLAYTKISGKLVAANGLADLFKYDGEKNKNKEVKSETNARQKDSKIDEKKVVEATPLSPLTDEEHLAYIDSLISKIDADLMEDETMADDKVTLNKIKGGHIIERDKVKAKLLTVATAEVKDKPAIEPEKELVPPTARLRKLQLRSNSKNSVRSLEDSKGLRLKHNDLRHRANNNILSRRYAIHPRSNNIDRLQKYYYANKGRQIIKPTLKHRNRKLSDTEPEKSTKTVNYASNHSILSKDIKSPKDALIIKGTTFKNYNRESSITRFSQDFDLFGKVNLDDHGNALFNSFHPIQQKPKQISALKVIIDDYDGIDLYIDARTTELSLNKEQFIKLLSSHFDTSKSNTLKKMDPDVTMRLQQTSAKKVSEFVNDIALRYKRYISPVKIEKLNRLRMIHKAEVAGLDSSVIIAAITFVALLGSIY